MLTKWIRNGADKEDIFLFLLSATYTLALRASLQARLVNSLMRLLTAFILTIYLTGMGPFLNYDCRAQSRTIIESLNKFDSSRTVFYLPANTRLDEVLWRDSVYRFPSFEFGRVTFATSYSPQEQIRMNYNFYYMQMDFISEDGDTLQVTPSKELKLVSISGHLFYYDQKVGYIEVIQQFPVALGVRNMMKPQYFAYLPGGTVKKTSDYRYDYRLVSLFSDEDPRGTTTTLDRYYLKEYDYFFIGKDNQVYKATPAAVFKLFREHKKAVKIYIDEHNVDFEKKEHLMNLLIFCNGLRDKI
ncbi:MAG TPA: hypothetical protein VK589_03005 [Chryseolinea sp.]|nr:hypothetical protein [Chryseolinea sp.]